MKAKRLPTPPRRGREIGFDNGAFCLNFFASQMQLEQKNQQQPVAGGALLCEDRVRSAPLPSAPHKIERPAILP